MKTFRGIAPLVAAIIGVIALGWSFAAGISAALSGSGSGALPYTIVFLMSMAVVLAALVFAVVNLVKKQSRMLAAMTIVVAAIPLIVIVALRVSTVVN